MFKRRFKYILEFARFSDILITNNNEFGKLANTSFKSDTRLIYSVKITSLNKEIFIKWNHSPNHSMIDRIKNRTSFKSISEFNEFISKVINILIEKYSSEIDKDDRYSLYFPNRNFYLLIDINPDSLYKKYTLLFIPTLLNHPANVYKNFKIDDDFL